MSLQDKMSERAAIQKMLNSLKKQREQLDRDIVKLASKIKDIEDSLAQ